MWVRHICHIEVALLFQFSNFPPAISKQELFHSDFLARFSEVDTPWTIRSLKNAEGVKACVHGISLKEVSGGKAEPVIYNTTEEEKGSRLSTVYTGSLEFNR